MILTLLCHTLLQALPDDRDGQKQLLWWWVEDAVKKRYSMFISALEECSKDNLEFLKNKATKVSISVLWMPETEYHSKILRDV